MKGSISSILLCLCYVLCISIYEIYWWEACSIFVEYFIKGLNLDQEKVFPHISLSKWETHKIRNMEKRRINFSLTAQLYLRSHVGHILLSVKQNGGNWSVHCLQIIRILLTLVKCRSIVEIFASCFHLCLLKIYKRQLFLYKMHL